MSDLGLIRIPHNVGCLGSRCRESEIHIRCCLWFYPRSDQSRADLQWFGPTSRPAYRCGISCGVALQRLRSYLPHLSPTLRSPHAAPASGQLLFGRVHAESTAREHQRHLAQWRRLGAHAGLLLNAFPTRASITDVGVEESGTGFLIKTQWSPLTLPLAYLV